MSSAPHLDGVSEFYWKAFHEISSDRPPAMSGISSIPFGSIIAYANFIGLTREERDNFVYILRSIDCIYCGEVRKKIDAASKRKAS